MRACRVPSSRTDVEGAGMLPCAEAEPSKTLTRQLARGRAQPACFQPGDLPLLREPRASLAGALVGKQAPREQPREPAEGVQSGWVGAAEGSATCTPRRRRVGEGDQTLSRALLRRSARAGSRKTSPWFRGDGGVAVSRRRQGAPAFGASDVSSQARRSGNWWNSDGR